MTRGECVCTLAMVYFSLFLFLSPLYTHIIYTHALLLYYYYVYRAYRVLYTYMYYVQVLAADCNEISGAYLTHRVPPSTLCVCVACVCVWRVT